MRTTARPHHYQIRTLRLCLFRYPLPNVIGPDDKQLPRQISQVGKIKVFE
jgi:hypothetical protein